MPTGALRDGELLPQGHRQVKGGSGWVGVVHTDPDPPVAPASHIRHRFPAEVISHCVWLYLRFGLGLRDVPELVAERGVAVTYETVHQWCRNA